MTSALASRAVSMSTGVRLPRSRMWRTTPKPSNAGNMTSSTATSNYSAPTVSKALKPDAVRSTTCPSSLSPLSRSVAMRGSSSTRRRRIEDPLSRSRSPTEFSQFSGASDSIGRATMNVAGGSSTMPTNIRRCLVCQVLVGMAVSLAAPLAAQVRDPASLSLADAVDRAMAANPTIAAARLTTAINQAGLAVAGERPNPEVTAEFEKETPKQGFGVAVPLELGGKRSKRIAVSQATIRAGAAEIAATIVQVRNDVRRAYYDLLVTEARLGLLRELRDLSGRVRDTAQTRFESGDAPRLEVLQAGLALAASENDAAAAEGALTAAR